jgi:hypothetical protein
MCVVFCMAGNGNIVTTGISGVWWSWSAPQFSTGHLLLAAPATGQQLPNSITPLRDGLVTLKNKDFTICLSVVKPPQHESKATRAAMARNDS